MVNLIIEHVLSTCSNRLLFETLWNLAVSKVNPRNCENYSVVQICDNLIEQIRSDTPDRNKFYFNSQLTFGLIQLYRHQINKLLHQVKAACQSCNATFYDINWLSEMSDQLTVENFIDSQLKSGGKKSAGKQKKSIKLSDFDLIEQAFMIPDAPVEKSNNKKIKNVDPTLATNEHAITILENSFFRTSNSGRFIDPTAIEITDEFCDSTQFNFAFVLNQSNDLTNDNREQELAEITPQGIDFRRESGNFTEVKIPEIPLCDDILEILKSQSQTREKRSGCEDLSSRIGPPKKKMRFDQEENNENVPPISDYDDDKPQVNENAMPEEISHKKFQADKSLRAEELKLAPVQLKLSPVRQNKQHKRAKTVIFDKTKKISNKVLLSNRDSYVEKFTELPMETWFNRLNLMQSSNESFFTSPGSRLKTAAKKLMPCFERNLKKIPIRILKRPQAAMERCASPKPAKMLKLDTTSLQRTNFDYDIPEQLSITSNHEMSNHAIDLPAYDLEELNIVPTADVPSSEGKTTSTPIPQPAKVWSNITEFRDKDRISKTEIIGILTTHWQRSTKKVTMAKLTSKKNRFVAAGIFFELMVLSKEGAVELSQSANLEISNIKPGRNVDLYAEED